MSHKAKIAIGTLGTYINGRGFKPEDWGCVGLPIVRIANLNNPNAAYDFYDGPIDEGHRIDTGDIVVSWSATLDAFRWDRGPAALNQHSFKVVPDLSVIDPGYLYFVLKAAMKGMSELVHGATMKHVTRPEFEGFQIEIETEQLLQKKIAVRLKAQLAEVEKARQAAQTQLRDAAALKSKALEALFSGIENEEPIGAAAKLQSGYAFKSDTFKTSGVRLLRNANILPRKVYWDDAVFLSAQDSEKYSGYILNDGDVLISLDRPIISSGIKAARVSADDLPALLVQRVGRFLIDPAKLDADYLYAYLQTGLFISEISGHDQSLGVPHISPTQVESVEIPLPEVAVQRELAKRLKQVMYTWQVAAAAMQSQLNDLSKLPKAILAQAFEM